MPNYCDCTLCVYSPEDGEDNNLAEISSFLSTEETKLSFDKVIPYPEKFRLLDDAARNWENEQKFLKDSGAIDHINWGDFPKDGYNQGGYEWCIENWGTKWNALRTTIEYNNDYQIIYHFQTAWNPPTPVVLKLSKLYPENEITLEYYEMGMQFCGSMRVKNGAILDEAESKYYGHLGG